MKPQKRQIVVAVLAAFALVLLSSASALAQDWIITDDPELPPLDGVYRTAEQVHAEFDTPLPPIIMENILHQAAFVRLRWDDAGDEHEEFESILRADVTISGNPVGQVELTGPVETVVRGKTGNTTGTFDTEIIAMSLVGSVGGGTIEIQESPSQPSQGQTTITDIGGGLYQIDSFFDVFTELRADFGGGFSPWVPQINGPSRVDLQPFVPEPGAAALMLLGLGGVARLRRRK